jgi:hypothetical protein
MSLSTKERSRIFIHNTIEGSGMAGLLGFLKDPNRTQVTLEFAGQLCNAVEIVLMTEGISALDYIKHHLTDDEKERLLNILTVGGIKNEFIIFNKSENVEGKITDLLFMPDKD